MPGTVQKFQITCQSRLTYLPFNHLAAPSTQAWVTLATNDSYALGALVLASSLKRTNTARKIVVMVTPEGLSPPMKSQLNSAFDEVVDVSLLDSKDKVNLSLMERPELGVTFTKLHCWRLVQYTKCVFLDADTMVSIMYIYSRGVNSYINLGGQIVMYSAKTWVGIGQLPTAHPPLTPQYSAVEWCLKVLAQAICS